LKSALFHGGLSEETLAILLAEDTTDDASVKSSAIQKRKPQESLNQAECLTQGSSEDGLLSPGKNSWRYSHSRRQSGGAFNESLRSPSGVNFDYGKQSAQQRTLFFNNLPSNATHKDLTKIIRGGRLLDIHLRTHDRSAAVSFVEGAGEFLEYANKNGIFLHGCRLEVRWAGRQFHLPDHISHKIGNGATRNLIIRGAAPKLSGNRIREDMEHIHNLVVVDVYFQKEDVFISLNSVHNTLYARSCMMSRLPYKGSKIEFYPDECSAPIPKSVVFKKAANGFQKSHEKTKAGAKTNIYALLEMDPSEASSDEEESQSYGVSLDWKDKVPPMLTA
jgi:hypothetical protein